MFSLSQILCDFTILFVIKRQIVNMTVLSHKPSRSDNSSFTKCLLMKIFNSLIISIYLRHTWHVSGADIELSTANLSKMDFNSANYISH
jgi:hypothetical protein